MTSGMLVCKKEGRAFRLVGDVDSSSVVGRSVS